MPRVARTAVEDIKDGINDEVGAFGGEAMADIVEYPVLGPRKGVDKRPVSVEFELVEGGHVGVGFSWGEVDLHPAQYDDRHIEIRQVRQ